MRNYIKRLRILSLLLCLPLTGCLDVAQELWINSDGSGRMKIEIGLHEQLMLMQGKTRDDSTCDSFFEEKALMEEREGVESAEYKSYKEGGVFYCVADIKVSDYTQLKTLQDESLKASSIDTYRDSFLREFSLRSLDEGNGFFRQHVSNHAGDASKQNFQAHAEQLANTIMGRMMTGRYWSVTFHTPGLLEANGTVSEDNKTVSWRVPLYDLLIDEQYAFDMQATFEANVPWYKKIWNWMT